MVLHWKGEVAQAGARKEQCSVQDVRPGRLEAVARALSTKTANTGTPTGNFPKFNAEGRALTCALQPSILPGLK